MCQMFRMPNGEWIHTMGGARRVFKVLIQQDFYFEGSLEGAPEYCTCPIDLEKTAHANGMVAIFDTDSGDWYLGLSD